MQYFHSNKSFNQYKPHQSFWQKIKAKRQKKVMAGDIQELGLKNPYKKKPPTPKNKTKWVFVVLILLIVSWIVLMLTLPYFKISKITINGNKITKATEVENYVRQYHFSKNNYFLFPDKSTAEKITETFLYQNVQIKKVFPDTIVITVNEKPASVIYDDNTNYYLLDNDGKVIKQLSEFSYIPTVNISTSSPNFHLVLYQQIQNSYGIFPVIYNENPTTDTKKYLISPKLIKSAIEWGRIIKDQEIGELQYFKIGETDFNLKIFLKQPWYILINTDLDSQIQLKNLKIITSNNKPTEYIDLRFGERVYWK